MLPALIASTFLNRTRQDIDTISALVERSFPFLQAEFFLEADHLPNRLQQSIHALADCGLISADDDTPSLWRRPRIGSEQSVSLLQLGRLIAPVLERYYLTAVLLFQAPTADSSASRWPSSATPVPSDWPSHMAGRPPISTIATCLPPSSIRW